MWAWFVATVLAPIAESFIGDFIAWLKAKWAAYQTSKAEAAAAQTAAAELKAAKTADDIDKAANDTLNNL